MKACIEGIKLFLDHRVEDVIHIAVHKLWPIGHNETEHQHSKHINIVPSDKYTCTLSVVCHVTGKHQNTNMIFFILAHGHRNNIMINLRTVWESNLHQVNWHYSALPTELIGSNFNKTHHANTSLLTYAESVAPNQGAELCLSQYYFLYKINKQNSI